MANTFSNIISNRNFLIGLVIVVVVGLFAWGYFSPSKQNKTETRKGQTSSTQTSPTVETKKTVGVVSVVPAENSQIALSSAPSETVIKVDKELTAGSEIKVVSDKGVDVVPSGNKLSEDL